MSSSSRRSEAEKKKEKAVPFRSSQYFQLWKCNTLEAARGVERGAISRSICRFISMSNIAIDKAVSEVATTQFALGAAVFNADCCKMGDQGKLPPKSSDKVFQLCPLLYLVIVVVSICYLI